MKSPIEAGHCFWW